MSQAGIAGNGGGGGGGNVQTLTGNTGGAVGPTANNINVVGATLYTTAGNPGTSTLTINPRVNAYPITPYVVGPVGEAGYQTIQSAINAANAAGGGFVWIMDGTYTENLTFFPNISISGPEILSGYPGDPNSCVIIGQHTPPTSGAMTLNNITVISATDAFLSNAAGTAELNFTNCTFGIADGFLLNVPNWTGILSFWDCNSSLGTNDGGINNSAGAPLYAYEVGLGFGSAHTMQLSGTAIMEGGAFYCPATLTNSAFTLDNNQFYGTLTFAGTSTGLINVSRFTPAIGPAITMSSSGSVEISTSVINTANNPAINGAGAGTLTLGDITYVNNTAIAGTVTKAFNVTETGIAYLQNVSFNRGTTTVSSNGQLIIGNTGNNPSISTLTAGAGILITNGPGSITISGSGGGFTWSDQAGSFPAVKQNGYFCTAVLTATLPGLPAEGDTIAIICDTASVVTIQAQGAQKIRFSGSISAAAGTAASTAQGDSMTLVYRSATTTWIALSGNGNWTIT